MFILNLTKDELVYRAHGEVIKLKKGLNLINNCITSAKELKNHFGEFIKFVGDEIIEPIKEKKAEPKVEVKEEKAEETIIIEEEKPAELEEVQENTEVQEALDTLFNEEVKEEVTEEKAEKAEKPAKKSTKNSTKNSTKKSSKK